MSEEIPFDTWTKIPNPELAKIGRCSWVYRPSHYNGPLAVDGYIKKEILDLPGTPDCAY